MITADVLQAASQGDWDRAVQLARESGETGITTQIAVRILAAMPDSIRDAAIEVLDQAVSWGPLATAAYVAYQTGSMPATAAAYAGSDALMQAVAAQMAAYLGAVAPGAAAAQGAQGVPQSAWGAATMTPDGASSETVVFGASIGDYMDAAWHAAGHARKAPNLGMVVRNLNVQWESRGVHTTAVAATLGGNGSNPFALAADVPYSTVQGQLIQWVREMVPTMSDGDLCVFILSMGQAWARTPTGRRALGGVKVGSMGGR